jgi:hypothetical protein
MGVAWALSLSSSEPNHWRNLLIASFFLSLMQAAMFPMLNVGELDDM